jgi:hypothetical protein
MNDESLIFRNLRCLSASSRAWNVKKQVTANAYQPEGVEIAVYRLSRHARHRLPWRHREVAGEEQYRNQENARERKIERNAVYRFLLSSTRFCGIASGEIPIFWSIRGKVSPEFVDRRIPPLELFLENGDDSVLDIVVVVVIQELNKVAQLAAVENFRDDLFRESRVRVPGK